jgi:peptide-methionine (R)-S-oxide reductase
MTTRRHLLWTAGAGTAAALAASLFPRTAPAAASSEIFEVSYTDAEWRARLTPEQYQILRKEGTERAGTSPLNKEHRAGTFACVGCALPLFSSKTKFNSGTGWPSFWQPLDKAVATRQDRTYGMLRTEVHCRRCGGPKPTGLRYCMNGLSLTFTPQPA